MLEKENAILEKLRKESREAKYTTLIVELKIHDGYILAGEILENRKKLG